MGLLVGLVVVLGACATDEDPGRASDPSSTTTAEIDPSRRRQEIRSADVLGDIDVVTMIEQPRYLEGTRRITIPVRFEGEGRFRVTGIAVRAPQFEPLPVEVIDVAMVPGQRVALQVDLGAPVCGAMDGSAPAVHLDVGVDDDAPMPLEVPVPAWLIEEMHDEQCVQAAVADQARVRFGAPGALDGATVRTELVLERTGGDQPVALTELTGSVILVVDPADPVAADRPLARLGSDDRAVRLPVEVTAARCDAHSVSGSTKTFVFHAWLQVGDEPPVRLDLRPGAELEDAMSRAIEACIAGIDTDPRPG